MAICYSYILSLLFSLLLIHWIDSASLRFPVYSTQHRRNSSMMKNNNYFISESTYPDVPLLKRLRRWITHGDNDEVEIPLDESILLTNSSHDRPTLLNSTMLSFETTTTTTTESNSSLTKNVTDLINSTIAFQISSDENSTMKYSLLRLDLTESNQTTDSIMNEVIQENTTSIYNATYPSVISEIVTDINQTIFNDKNGSIISFNEFQITTVPIIINQTDSPTIAVPLDYFTVVPNPPEDDQTNNLNISFNNKSETTILNDSSIIIINDESMINSNISQKDAIITVDQDVSMNDTEIIFLKTTTSSSQSVKPSIVPVCDSACLCLKECPYGFEIVNDTCLCSPPCQNYQCFGNDTCIVTDEGQPLCQRENGIEYHRPTRCYQPRDAGYHDVSMRYYNRWYYHPDQDTCHLFVYRGLGGNENNFRTLHECHSECITCAPLPDPGECLGHINMWYYDKKTSECKEFEYSGCKGNDNKFFKKETCIDTCINRIANIK